MNQLTKVALLLGVFLLGCAAEDLVVPPARAGTSPTRWEYACKTGYAESDVATIANKFGPEGWELAGVGSAFGGGSVWCFKRPCLDTEPWRLVPLPHPVASHCLSELAESSSRRGP
jgi:hypothetical protein